MVASNGRQLGRALGAAGNCSTSSPDDELALHSRPHQPVREVGRQVQTLHRRRVVTAVRSPSQDGYGERVVGTLKRECLHHVIVFNEGHARRVLRGGLEFHHGSRTHLIPWRGRRTRAPRPNIAAKFGDYLRQESRSPDLKGLATGPRKIKKGRGLQKRALRHGLAGPGGQYHRVDAAGHSPTSVVPPHPRDRAMAGFAIAVGSHGDLPAVDTADHIPACPMSQDKVNHTSPGWPRTTGAGIAV